MAYRDGTVEGFRKIKDTVLGVPIAKTIVCCRRYWIPHHLEQLQSGLLKFCRSHRIG